MLLGADVCAGALPGACTAAAAQCDVDKEVGEKLPRCLNVKPPAKSIFVSFDLMNSWVAECDRKVKRARERADAVEAEKKRPRREWLPSSGRWVETAKRIHLTAPDLAGQAGAVSFCRQISGKPFMYIEQEGDGIDSNTSAKPLCDACFELADPASRELIAAALEAKVKGGASEKGQQ